MSQTVNDKAAEAHQMLDTLPEESRQRVMRELVSSVPEKAITLINDEKRKLHEKRSRTSQMAGLARGRGLEVKLQGGLDARVFRLNNPRAIEAVRTIETANARGQWVYKIEQRKYDRHYVLETEIEKKKLFVVFSGGVAISRIYPALCADLTGTAHWLTLWSYDGIIYGNRDSGLLMKVLIEKIPPNIAALCRETTTGVQKES